MGAASDKPVVVYVEDDADTFKIAALRLRERYQLLWAQSDAEAVDLISFHQHQLYAVLMDIELRGSQLDGLELVQLLRGRVLSRAVPAFAKKLPTLRELPIIVLTAYTSRHTEAEILGLGATHFMTKPIEFARLTLALAQANIAQVMKRLTPQRTPTPAAPVQAATPPDRRRS